MAGVTAPFVFFVVFVLGTVNGATHADVIQLHENLTKYYNKDVRPTFNQSEPTRVNVSFYLLSIKELDEKTSKLSIVGFFTFSWNDFQLQWNFTDFDYTYSTFLSQNNVWKPELVLVNPYDEVKPLGYDRQNVRVIYNGDMYWTPVNVYQSTCEFDVTSYPFDNQTCIIVFSSIMYAPAELLLVSSSPKLDLTYFYRNGLWEVIDTSIHTDMTTSPAILLIIELKRRPLFHLLNTLIPLSVIGLLNVLVFLLPAESGERISFSITVLLAMAVFMTMVTDSLPSNSEPSVPLLCYYLLFDLGANVLITICAIMGLHLHHKADSQQVPKWLRCIVRCRHCLKRKGQDTVKRLVPDKKNNSADHSFQEETKYLYFDGSMITWPKLENKHNSLKDDSNTGNINEPSVVSKEQTVDITWKNVATFFDKLFFILFMAILILKNITAVITYLNI